MTLAPIDRMIALGIQANLKDKSEFRKKIAGRCQNLIAFLDGKCDFSWGVSSTT